MQRRKGSLPGLHTSYKPGSHFQKLGATTTTTTTTTIIIKPGEISMFLLTKGQMKRLHTRINIASSFMLGENTMRLS
jgi:hypothetical protein